jgi:hypothetical protein
MFNFGRYLRKRPRVKVKSVRKGNADGGQLYELSPETYAGPWTLPEGTVLAVVSTPPLQRKESPQ